MPENCSNNLLNCIRYDVKPEIIDLLKLKECKYNIEELKEEKNIYKELDTISLLDYSFAFKNYKFLFEKGLQPYSDMQPDESKYKFIQTEKSPINNSIINAKKSKNLLTMAYTQYGDKTLYSNYINMLDSRDKYNLRQYTYHGDEIVNSMLNLMDTIDWYKKHTLGINNENSNNYIVFSNKNIDDDYIGVEDKKIIIKKVLHKLLNNNNVNEIFFIFYYVLFDFQVKGLVKRFPNFKIKYYITNIIPRLHKIMNNLDLLRVMTYNYFKGLYRIISLFPKMKEPFIVYRGVKKHYLFVQNKDDVMPLSYLSTFTSASRSKEVALSFTDPKEPIIYIFYAHPQCSYAPIETISRYPGEKEFLFIPYHRYLFMSYKYHHNIYHYEFAILPGDIPPPDNYGDYKIWKENYDELQKKFENYKKLPNAETKKGGRYIVPQNFSNTRIFNNTINLKNTRKNNHIKIEMGNLPNNRYNKTKKNQNRKMQSTVESNIVETNEKKLADKSRLGTPLDVLFTRKSTDEEKKLALEIYNYFKKK